MGTRGFSGFIIDGKIVASYQQFDSYPSGVGKDVLAFARTVEPRFAEVVDQVRTLRLVPADGKPNATELAALADVGVTPRKVSTGDDWYAALRQNQGDLQAMLQTGVITDDADFLKDSLLCEWAYIVDLDEQTLRVYAAATEPTMTYRLDALPSDEQFFDDLGEDD